MQVYDDEEFWDDLLAFIEEGRVIPVVGAELLTVQVDGSQTVPLYRAVADRLLERYSLRLTREHYGLYDAVAAVAAAGRRVQDLYRQINDIQQKLVAQQDEILRPLGELASIRQFDCL